MKIPTIRKVWVVAIIMIISWGCSAPGEQPGAPPTPIDLQNLKCRPLSAVGIGSEVFLVDECGNCLKADPENRSAPGRLNLGVLNGKYKGFSANRRYFVLLHADRKRISVFNANGVRVQEFDVEIESHVGEIVLWEDRIVVVPFFDKSLILVYRLDGTLEHDLPLINDRFFDPAYDGVGTVCSLSVSDDRLYVFDHYDFMLYAVASDLSTITTEKTKHPYFRVLEEPITYSDATVLAYAYSAVVVDDEVFVLIPARDASGRQEIAVGSTVEPEWTRSYFVDELFEEFPIRMFFAGEFLGFLDRDARKVRFLDRSEVAL